MTAAPLAPAAILDDARRQYAAYPTARFVNALATSAHASDAGFEVAMDSGEAARANRLVLATGVHDTLPEIPGLQEQWGKTVLHCPYCTSRRNRCETAA